MIKRFIGPKLFMNCLYRKLCFIYQNGRGAVLLSANVMVLALWHCRIPCRKCNSQMHAWSICELVITILCICHRNHIRNHQKNNTKKNTLALYMLSCKLCCINLIHSMTLEISHFMLYDLNIRLLSIYFARCSF